MNLIFQYLSQHTGMQGIFNITYGPITYEWGRKTGLTGLFEFQSSRCLFALTKGLGLGKQGIRKKVA